MNWRELGLPRKPKMDIGDAVQLADAADLPDGAWIEYLVELTGMDDAGDICTLLEQEGEGHDNDDV